MKVEYFFPFKYFLCEIQIDFHNKKIVDTNIFLNNCKNGRFSSFTKSFTFSAQKYKLWIRAKRERERERERERKCLENNGMNGIVGIHNSK